MNRKASPIPERLLSAAACAEIQREIDNAQVPDDREYVARYTPALLATVAALREALKPFAEVGHLHSKIRAEVPIHSERCTACRAAAVYAETK